MSSLDEPLAMATSEVEPTASVWSWLDARISQLGDHVNPILIKEVRQALKSRQFLVTFTLVLACSWLWSIFGLALIGPSVSYVTAGPEMFYGYYFILALPLLVIVPFSAFRSLASEREDRTYELIQITTLEARQIIRGKLAVSVLQIVVFMSAVLPCLSFTYLLRGLDLPTILLIVFYTMLESLGLSAICLLGATSTTERYRQVVLFVALIIGLLYAFGGSCALTYEMLSSNGNTFDRSEFWIFNAALLTFYFSYFALTVQAAATQIAFSTSNRSTPLRITVFIQQCLFCGWMAYGSAKFGDPEEAMFAVMGVSLVHWFVVGVFTTGEPSHLSPRVKRQLPQSFFGRALLTWFNPGPGTGYMFSVGGQLTAVVSALVIAFVFGQNFTAASVFNPSVRMHRLIVFAVLSLSYLVLFLGTGRLLLSMAARVMPVGLFLRAFVHLLVVMVATMVPLLIQLMSDDITPGGYSLLQATNPLWTLFTVAEKQLLPPEIEAVTLLISAAAAVVFLFNLPSICDEVAQVRMTAPVRVMEEDAELAAQHAPAEKVAQSPWDEP